jgi:hypothetical protein
MRKAPQRIKVKGHIYIRADENDNDTRIHESVVKMNLLRDKLRRLRDRVGDYASALEEIVSFATRSMNDGNEKGVKNMVNAILHVNDDMKQDVSFRLRTIESIVNDFRDMQKAGITSSTS